MTQLRVVPGGRASPAELAAESDRDVLARVVERDQAAHRVIFERYYKRVLAFVRRRIGDEGLAEEITTDVFFEVWRNAAAYRGESPVTTWIFGIANLKTLSARRYFAQPRRSSVRVAPDEALARVPDPCDQDESISARIEDPWQVLNCQPDPAGCVVTVSDESFAAEARDTLYYARAVEEPSLAVGANPLGCERDASGRCVKMDPIACLMPMAMSRRFIGAAPVPAAQSRCAGFHSSRRRSSSRR